MIKFSWKKINDKLDWNASSVLEYFFLKQGLKLPDYLSRRVPQKVWKYAMYPYEEGPCFMINPNIALERATAPNDLYWYFELASKRNYLDYVIRGVRHLPLPLVPKFQVEWVEINPMLIIDNGNVYFKYEQEITDYGYKIHGSTGKSV